jgi:23S rRNA G2069 N7-methylase RlmK/C1962 C5-methylase RlmI
MLSDSRLECLHHYCYKANVYKKVTTNHQKNKLCMRSSLREWDSSRTIRDEWNDSRIKENRQARAKIIYNRNFFRKFVESNDRLNRYTSIQLRTFFIQRFEVLRTSKLLLALTWILHFHRNQKSWETTQVFD